VRRRIVTAPDDQSLYAIRKDLSGGVNTRQDAGNIGETQASILYNVDISTAGQTSKRPGCILIGDSIDSSVSNSPSSSPSPSNTPSNSPSSSPSPSP
jgi:hypothetical protein